MDMVMLVGEADGFDLARHVATARPDSIVVVTGLPEDRPADLPERVKFLPKPVALRHFATALFGDAARPRHG